VSRAVARDEDLRRCVERLRALDEDERAVVIYCGLEGLTAPEASAFLGASPDAVAKRWQRLRSRLREFAEVKDFLAPDFSTVPGTRLKS
jgi:DNA-directed RNA polymerase specialized sigma24 family protein